MSLNDTPKGERVHIALFGKRNAGKSSVINALTGQALAIVSETKGTTTDPVYKAMELLPLGPVELIDTPGLDDEGELGKQRIEKAYEVLRKTDLAVLVVDGNSGISIEDEELLLQFEKLHIPFLIAVNKSDFMSPEQKQKLCKYFGIERTLCLSSKTGENIQELKEKLAYMIPKDEGRQLVKDLLHPSDTVILVVPIDSAAPKGRLILPQQQVIRDILEANATAVICRENELRDTLVGLKKAPALVITDSQVFGQVHAELPREIPLTSFSILFARYKGELRELIAGARSVKELKDGDTVLIAEGCTHHRQCDDIGTVKIPNWLQKFTNKKLRIETTSGNGFPADLSGYALIVHCGGCMLNQREMQHRISAARKQGIPIVNYGVLIAAMQGILERTIECFSADL